MRRAVSLIGTSVLGCSVAVGLVGVPNAEAQGRPPEWRHFGGDAAHTRYSALDQIHRGNVASLRIAWRRPGYSETLSRAFPEQRISPYLKSTPIIIDGVLYAQGADGVVMALDPATGRTLWEQQLDGSTPEEAIGVSSRGVAYWTGGTEGNDKRIVAIRDEYLYAFNAETGVPSETFGLRGRERLTHDHPLAGRFASSTGPVIVGDVVVVAGNTNGSGDQRAAEDRWPSARPRAVRSDHRARPERRHPDVDRGQRGRPA
jgi:quinoprotein glucose dehydrogenase